MRVVFLFLRLHSCSDVAIALGEGVSTPGAAGQAGKAPRGVPSSPPEHFPSQDFRGLVSWWSASSSQTWKRGGALEALHPPHCPPCSLAVKCSVCKSVSDTYDPYLDVALEIRV